MYRIAIADDEGIVIDALKFIIEKNFSQECIIESTKTGRGFIELVESFRPDIAFVDIQMPGFSGIDAMTEIRKTNSNIIFIVLTAYDKFKYAQESIKLGVFDYINKPINQPIIVNCLQQAMMQIRKEREKRSYELMIREKMEIVIPIVESVMIYSILFQENYEREINNFKQLLGIEQTHGFMMVIECGDSIEGSHVTNALGATVKIQSYYQSIRDIIKEYFYCIIGSMMANMMIIFVPCEALVESIEYEERIQLINKTREMTRRLRKQTDVQFRVSIGSIKTDRKSVV